MQNAPERQDPVTTRQDRNWTSGTSLPSWSRPMAIRREGRAKLATLTRGCPGAGGQRTAEILQAALESLEEIGIDGWLPFGIAA